MQQPVSSANWPSDSLALLLRAVLEDRDAARHAWREWKNQNDLAKVDHASFAILPQLYRNLERLGVEDEETAILRGVYKQTWTRNNFLLQGLSQVSELLEREGVPLLAIKGMPLALFSYQDLGARSMSDFDVAVPDAEFTRALAALHNEGWTESISGTGADFPEFLWAYLHARPFKNPAGQRVDLHRRILGVETSPSYDGEVFGRSLQKSYRNLSLQVPDPADMVIITCYHARKAEAQSVGRWIVDLFRLLDSPPAVDWAVLFDRLRSSRLMLPVRDALTYANKQFALPVPGEFLEEAWREPVSAADEAEYRRLTFKRPRLTAFALWSSYRSLHAGEDRPQDARSFPDLVLSYYRWRLDVPTRARVPMALLKGVWRRRRAPRSPGR